MGHQQGALVTVLQNAAIVSVVGGGSGRMDFQGVSALYAT
jgi:hypothetical protein